MKRAVLQAKEKDASSYFTLISIEEHGFAFTKSEFRDAIRIWYKKQLQERPRKCPCGQKCDLNHTINCKRGGFVAMRHNSVRDLKTIQNDVKIEPALQKIYNERIDGQTVDEARPNIQALGVWQQLSSIFFYQM